MSHMRGFVGIDAGVLDKPKPGAAHLRVLISRHTSCHLSAIELDVQVARPGHLHARETGASSELRLQFRSDRPRRTLQPLGQFKSNGECHLSKLKPGRQLNGKSRDFYAVKLSNGCLDARL